MCREDRLMAVVGLDSVAGVAGPCGVSSSARCSVCGSEALVTARMNSSDDNLGFSDGVRDGALDEVGVCAGRIIGSSSSSSSVATGSRLGLSWDGGVLYRTTVVWSSLLGAE